jgi:NADH pyrophosphatase NudC (nudix superfamily)
MVGFMARAVGGTLTVNTDELESADWYRRADLQNRTDDASFRLPGTYSIARRLIEDWLDGRLPG